jgi:hypothetical protein
MIGRNVLDTELDDGLIKKKQEKTVVLNTELEVKETELQNMKEY